MIWISLIIAVLAVIISLAVAYVAIIRLQEAVHLLNKELRYERKR